MTRITPILLLALLLGFAVPGGSRAFQPAEFDPAAVDRFITQQMAAQRIPGLALAITQGEQVLYVQGYGDAGDGRPVTPQTQFLIASVSKSFTALAVMQLVEAGKIDLDAPVQHYLPEFTLADSAAASQITIRQLLNHTSGLSETTYADLVQPQPETIAERATSLRNADPVAHPGTEYHYFNPNYGVLARVVEVVSGQRFSEYLTEHIFQPLGMRHTVSAVTFQEGKQVTGRQPVCRSPVCVWNYAAVLRGERVHRRQWWGDHHCRGYRSLSDCPAQRRALPGPAVGSTGKHPADANPSGRHPDELRDGLGCEHHGR